jgi:hypothetical protein
MNHLVFNTDSENFKSNGYGLAGTNARAFLVDGQGKLQLSPATLNAFATNLDIGDLNAGADQVTITAINLDIRNLNGEQDSLQIYSRSTASDSVSATLLALQTVNLLTENVGPFRHNTYFVKNTSIGVAVTISLQLAPLNNDSYFVTDGSAFSLIAGGTITFTPSKVSKYARIQLSSLLLGSVQAFYFGQS